MAEVDDLPMANGFSLGSTRVRTRTVWALLAVLCAMALIGVWNRYIFAESNAVLLLAVVSLSALVLRSGRVPQGLRLPGITVPVLVLALYAWARLGDPWDLRFEPFPAQETWSLRPAFTYVVDIFLYYGLFLVAAWAFYRYRRFPKILWLMTCAYIVAFIARNSVDVAGLQEGYNLSPGFVLITLLPFVFFGRSDRNWTGRAIPLALWSVCVLWLALIGARTAVGALLIFLTMIYLWPLITRNRVLFNLTFWGAVASLVGLYALYLLLATTSSEALIEGTGIGIFQKRIGTRIDIWGQLVYIISLEPWFGYGTGQSTGQLAPLEFLEFTANRDNLSAHSAYFEVLYRWGLVGLALLAGVFSRIWAFLWWGKDDWSVRVSGAFLISILFFSSTGEFLILNELRLRSGLAWVILGMGVGASLFARKAAQHSSSPHRG